MNSAYSIIENENGRGYRDDVEEIFVPIPDGMDFLGLVTPRESDPGDLSEMLEAAMARPQGARPLSELAAGKRTAGIIVSDATRAVATAKTLPFVIGELERGGIALSDIVLVVALGVHRPATLREMREICGEYAGRVRIENHDPYGDDNLVSVGTTSYGTEVRVNKTIHGCDLRIMIGKVEPHEFAGFSGGRKSVLPGIAAESTILHNHRPKMIMDANAAPGVLEGNPVHLDMLESAHLLRVDFCVNIVQNADGQPLAAFTGGLEEAHAAAVAHARAHYGAAVPGGANIYLTTPGRPLNIDFYQSIKPLIALYPALKRNDVVILYSSCPEGVQSEDMLRPFEGAGDIDEIVEYLMRSYSIQMDHALLLCKIYRKGVRVIACSDGVDDAVFATMLMAPAATVAEALEKAAAMKRVDGDRPGLVVFPAAQRMIVG